MKTYDATEQAYKNGYDKGYYDGKNARKKGVWIEDRVEGYSPFSEETYPIDVLQCSACKEYFAPSDARNYCPNCGADMRGEEDG